MKILILSDFIKELTSLEYARFSKISKNMLYDYARKRT